MREDKLNMFIKVLIVLIVLIASYTIVLCSIFYRKIDMPILVTEQGECYNVYDMLVRKYDYDMKYTRSKEQYRDMIEKQLGLNCYIYIEKEININYDGYMFAGIRVMVMEKGLSLSDYCIVFSHEALHFTKFSGNDTYINYEVFKFLYENEDAELRNIGIGFAMNQLLGRYGGRYNCSSYIVSYFIN